MGLKKALRGTVGVVIGALLTVSGPLLASPSARAASDAAATAPAHGTSRQIENPLAADQWFVQQRLGPQQTIPPGAYASALRQASALPALALPGAAAGSASGGAAGARWTNLGPAPVSGIPGTWVVPSSGRVSSIALDPNGTIYLGSAGGGVWSSGNNGQSWSPLTDQQPSLAMGALAVDPGNPQVVYAATGEAHYSNDSFYGEGILKSTDGGTTWTTIGADVFSGQHIAAIAVDPVDNNTLYVASDMGLWKSTDGGATWSILLGGNVTALVLSSSNRFILYAAVWGAGIVESTNGGASFHLLTAGLPTGSEVGNTALAQAPSAPDTLYASVSSGASNFGSLLGVYKTTDGGATWQQLKSAPDYFSAAFFYPFPVNEGAQGWYDNTIAVSPTNPNVVVAGGIGLTESTNGGVTWSSDLALPNGIHPDQHALVWDQQGNLYVGNDGGIWEITGAANPLTAVAHNLNTNLSITQFYPGMSIAGPEVLAGAQDNGTDLYTGSPTWTQVLGGDGMETAIDPANPQVMYAEYNYGRLRRSIDGGQHWKRGVAPPLQNANWVAPFVLDPANPSTLYLGGEAVYKSTNGGNSWTNLTCDTACEAVDNSGNTVTALAVAPSNPNVVYDGWRTGVVKVSEDGGTNWHSISPGVPRWVTGITVSPTDPNTVYVTLSGYYFPQASMSAPHVLVTHDANAMVPTWTNITGNLPNAPVNALALDGSTLIVASDVGVFASTNGGQTWGALGSGLPNTQVVDVRVSGGTVYAATHGRGVWTLPVGAPVASQTAVNAVTPSVGLPGAETAVTIGGSGFSGATAVNFGRVPAASFRVVSGARIIATTPPLPARTVNVTVTGTGASSASTPADLFTFRSPALQALSAASGYPDTPLSLTGGGFGAAPGGVTFREGSTTVTGAVYGWSGSGVQTIVPPSLTPGAVTVAVYTVAGATSNALPFTVLDDPAAVALRGPASIAAGGSVSLSGSVSDAQGKGLPGIPVSLTTDLGSLSAQSTTSGAAGAFSDQFLAPTTPGQASVTASVYSPVYGRIGTTIRLPVVAAAPAQITLNLPATTQAGAHIALSGQVTDPYGNPVPGIQVDLSASAGTLASASTQTGADGAYSGSLTVPTGVGDITLTATVHGTSVHASSSTFVTASAPGGLSLQVPASVTAGSQTLITGTVADAYGNPAGGATVDLTASAGTIAATTVAGKDGSYAATFTAPTTTGSATIAAALPGLAASSVSHTLAITAGAPASLTASAPASVPPGASATVTGTLADAYGNPEPDQQVAVTASAGTVPSSVTTATDGTFSVPFTAPGTGGNVTVTLSVPGTTLARTVTISVPAPPVTVTGTGGGGGGVVTGGGSLPVPSTPPGTATVVAGTTTVITLDGATLTVPAGALPAGTTVSLSAPVTPPAGTSGKQSLASPVFTISDGGMAPSAPLTLTLPVTLPGAATAGDLAVFALESGRWQFHATGSYDAQAGTLTATLAHPGTFVALVDTVSYPDVPSTYWAYQAIHELTVAGIVTGEPDGLFHPAASVTRAEFLTMLLGALGIQPKVAAHQPFSDVSAGAWYAGYVDSAAQMGILEGYGGEALPNQPITREAATVLLMRALGITHLLPSMGAEPSTPPTFRDQQAIATWAQPLVTRAVELGLVHGYPDGTFRPVGSLTRAEAATLAQHAFALRQAGAQPPVA